jgi:hypothetical protein
MKWLLVIVILFFMYRALSQLSDIEKDIIIERTIEFISESNEAADIDYTTFIEDFYLLIDNPLNINQASFEDLTRLNLLSDIQIQEILDYRYRYKQFLTIYELGAIASIDRNTVQVILPFIFVGAVVEKRVNWKNALKYGKHDVLMRYQRVIEEKEGYQSLPDSILLENPNKVYQGNPDRYYIRHRYTYKNKISYGFTGEKDAGETFFRADNAYGFDFYSAHLAINDVGRIKKIIVGDYHANFGQGLNIWTGFNMGRTVQTLKVKQSGTGLRPYTSANESQFFRGVGLTVDFHKIESTVFASFKRIDAAISNADTLDADMVIDNFQLTGYHRTLNEIAKKNTVGEMVLGAASSFQTNRFKINITGLYSKYSSSSGGNSRLYNQFNFMGVENLSFGLDYQYVLPKLSFFGEVASSTNAKFNAINGVLWQFDPKLDLVFVHRYLDKANQNLFSNNFARSSQNGQGIYLGIESRLNAKMNASVFYDQSKSDWFRYLIDGPSVERSFLGQLAYDINRYANVYIRLRSRLKERNISGGDYAITPQSTQETQSIRLHYSQRINRQFSVKTRIEWSRYEFNGEKSNGLLMYQDVIYTLKKIPLKLYGRYAMFDTDDYNARIYAYENDLLYVFSVPGYFYQGFRTYLMAKYDIGKKMDLWVRWSRTSYTNQNTISSGLEQINDHHKSDIKVQLKIRF